MLNKSLAAAAALMLIAGAAVAEEKAVGPIDTMEITPTGRIRALVEYDSRDNVDPEVSTDSTRLGFKAKGQAGEVGIFGELTANVNANGANGLTTRFGYIGVSLPKLGSLSMGRQQSIQDSFTDVADVFTSAGNNATQQMNFYQNNSLMYKNQIGGIKVGAQISAADGDAANNDIDRYEVGVGAYGFSVSMGQDEGTDTSYYGIGFAQKFGKVSVAASYSIADANDGGDFSEIILFNSDKTSNVTRGVEGALGFDVTDKVTVLAGYNLTDANGDEGVGIGEVQYGLGSQAFAFANVEYDLDASEYTTKVGLQINF